MKEVKQLTDGIIVPIPTPLLNFDKIDLEGLGNLVEHLVTSGGCRYQHPWSYWRGTLLGL